MSTASFNIAFENTMVHEGYYANLTGDQGGETYQGIARNFYPHWPGWSYVDRAKRENGGFLPNNFKISSPELSTYVKAFFHAEKWRKFQLDAINNIEVVKLIFDFVVHSRYAIREIQKVLRTMGYNQVVADNSMGPITITAINDADPAILYQRIKQQRIEYLKTLNQPGFLDAWIARVNRFNAFPQSANLPVNVAGIAALLGVGVFVYSKIRK
jgi:lysozyme family protein